MKYKLLKDLPGVKAGAESMPCGGMLDGLHKFGEGEDTHGYTKESMKQYPSWFAPIPEDGRPKKGDAYITIVFRKGKPVVDRRIFDSREDEETWENGMGWPATEDGEKAAAAKLAALTNALTGVNP